MVNFLNNLEDNKYGLGIEDEDLDLEKEIPKVSDLKPISVTPLDVQQEDENAKLDQELKNQMKISEVSPLERALTGASGLSSVVQQALAKRKAVLEGKDPTREIENIQRGQEQLEANISRKDALTAQLQERLAQREQAKKENELKRQQLAQDLGFKTRAEERAISEEDRKQKEFLAKQGRETQAANVWKNLLIKRGFKPEDIKDLTADVGEQLYKNQISLEEAKSRSGLSKYTNPAGAAAINLANQNAKKLQGENAPQLSPNASVAELENFNATLGTGTKVAGLQKGLIATIPEDKSQEQRKWLSEQSPKTKEEVTKVVSKFNNDLKATQDYEADLSTVRQLLQEARGIPSGQRNAFAAQALKNRVPRVIGGEKGVLTENDVNRMKGSQTFFDRGRRWINEKFLSGQGYTDKDLDEMESVINSMENRPEVLRQKFLNNRGQELKSLLGDIADPNQLILGKTSTFGQGQQEQSLPAQYKEGDIKKVKGITYKRINGQWIVQ